MDMDSLEPARTPDGGTITLTCRKTEVLPGPWPWVEVR